MIIDAHAHLWKKQQGIVGGKPVYDIGGGKSDFGGEVRQMMPPYMTDGENTAERFLSNMDYAGVSGAVITQEYIDGNQDSYLLSCKSDRIKICALYEEKEMGDISGFDGIKICAGRLKDKNLLNHLEVFRLADEKGKFISIDLADGDEQTETMQKIIKMFPELILYNLLTRLKIVVFPDPLFPTIPYVCPLSIFKFTPFKTKLLLYPNLTFLNSKLPLTFSIFSLPNFSFLNSLLLTIEKTLSEEILKFLHSSNNSEVISIKFVNTVFL